MFHHREVRTHQTSAKWGEHPILLEVPTVDNQRQQLLIVSERDSGTCDPIGDSALGLRSDMSAFIITRIQVGDYDAWRPMFDQDHPRAREKATAQRVFRGADDPSHVFILLEYASLEDARTAERRLLDSGVLDRFSDKHGPSVVLEAPDRAP